MEKTPTPHTIISTGTLEREIIKYLKNQKNNTISGVSYQIYNYLNKSREGVRDALKRLISKKLVERPFGTSYKLTSKGVEYCEQVIENQSGVCSRTVWREGELKTSTHHLNFKSKISKKPSELELNCISKKTLGLNNNKQELYYFEDIVIKLTTKSVIFYCPDILGITYNEAQFKALNLVGKYIKILKTKGLEVENITVESEFHFASINNVFANWISKHNDKFYLDLGDGVKVWIDRSHGDPELESNNEDLMERQKELLRDLKDTNYRLKDIGEIKTETNNIRTDLDKLIIITTNLVDISSKLVQNELAEPKISIKPKYVG